MTVRYITTRQAARRLGVSLAYIRKHYEPVMLANIPPGRTYLYREDDIFPS